MKLNLNANKHKYKPYKRINELKLDILNITNELKNMNLDTWTVKAKSMQLESKMLELFRLIK